MCTGCGNSLLGEQLFDDGYKNLTNTDISESVIKQMAGHCDKCARLKWSVADCRQLDDFADGQFDVVIEKATIEVFFVAQQSPWSVGESTGEAMTSVRRMAREIVRLLKPTTGQFFSISFTAPHFRKDLFARMFAGASVLGDDIDHPATQMKIVNVHPLGEHFHFYLYHLVNDPRARALEIFSYEPPKMTPLPITSEAAAFVEDRDRQDSEQFLFSISP